MCNRLIDDTIFSIGIHNWWIVWNFLFEQINVLFGGISLASVPHHELQDTEAAAIGAACAFLHVTFNTLPLERIMTVLAYRTELVSVLWNFMKHCHENQKWSALPELSSYLPEAPGWLLPLAVFCPVYKYYSVLILGFFRCSFPDHAILMLV